MNETQKVSQYTSNLMCPINTTSTGLFGSAVMILHSQKEHLVECIVEQRSFAVELI